MEAIFPTESESTVAAALLLLSCPSSSLGFLSSSSSSSSCFSDECFGDCKRKWKSVEELSPSDLKSCSSSLTSDGSTGESQADRLQALALAARLHDMKLKVVRRRRSKHYQNSGKQNNLSSKWCKLAIMTSALAIRGMETSPLSSASSSVHGAPRRQLTIRAGKKSVSSAEELRRQIFSSPCMKRRAEDILKFLSDGCSSEVSIRKVLGDRPDTSKALRMLLKLEQVKRSGTGGRKDPYTYMAVGTRSSLELA